MNRIMIFTLLALIAGLAVADAAGGEGSKKAKKRDGASAEKVGEAEGRKAKAKRERRERRARREKAGGVAAPIQTGTGGAAAENPAENPAEEPAAETPGTEEKLRVTGKILYGDALQVRKVAVVDVQKVFAAIPAYRKIQTENVPKHKARYHILVSQANQEFQAAVHAVALHDAFDLVVEKGGLKGGTSTDITELVLTRVSP